MIYIFGGAFDPPHAGHAAIVRAILHFKNPDKIMIIPSSERDDKKYKTTDEHRLKMLELFVQDIRDERVIIDDYFVKNWHGEMITKDVDKYARAKYGENLVHIFGTDTIASMPDWDAEKYAAEKIKKIFIPRDGLEVKMQELMQELEGDFVRFSPGVLPDPKYIKGGMSQNDSFALNGKTEYEGAKHWGARGGYIEYNPSLKNFAKENRNNPSSPEQNFWDIVRSKKMGYKFLRQKPIGEYIIDFYCSELRLAIEIDGDSHSENENYDKKRTEFLNQQGIHVLRYTNSEILKNIEGVYEDLKNRIEKIRNFNNVTPPNLPLSGERLKNFEIFTETHFPEISSTEIRAKIPEFTDISRLYDDNLKKFKIPGLSRDVSLYILENRLYRSHLPKEKLLVHVCCGPDVVMPILQLRDEYEIICFWYDPNIQPKSEYDKRYEAFKKVCEIEKIPFIKGAYDVKNFFNRIKGFEYTPEKTGEKCTRCYDMRMYVAARLAKKLKIPNYTTSLNTSPKKDLEKMFFMGHKYAEQFGVKFLDIPFRKRGGFEISTEYTKEHDIYRQNYCGCIYSIREGGDSDMKRKMVG